ncbi:MAG: PucR family transcriptional regulator [Nocardioidaceae bacterium]
MAPPEQRSIESLAAAVLLRVHPLSNQLVRTILETNPGYRRTNVVPEEDLWQSCRDNLTRILQLVVGSSEMQDGYFDAARATGTRRAEQGLPLDDVLRSFRMGGRLIWDALIEQARSVGDVDADHLLDVGSRVWEVVDQTSAHVAAAYHATERDLLRADEQRRVALWEGLLAGRGRDPSFATEATRIVGITPEGPYAVVVARPLTDYLETTRTLGERLASKSVDSAWHSRTDLLVGLLGLRRGDLQDALSVLRDSPELAVGVSLTVSALADADAAYRHAALALRTLTGGRSGVVALQERMPEALLVGSAELTQRLVEQWLGALLALPAHERDPLLLTLEHWVATAGSTLHTAEAVHCHRNTVINRMRKIEAVTGHDLSAPPIPVEIALALRAHRLGTFDT